MPAYVSIKEEVLSKLEANLPEIRERFGIETIGIFGSVARGDDTPESDVDVMISFLPFHTNYHNLLGVNHFLMDLFGRKVDVVTINGISPYIKPYVESDIIWKTTT